MRGPQDKKKGNVSQGKETPDGGPGVELSGNWTLLGWQGCDRSGTDGDWLQTAGERTDDLSPGCFMCFWKQSNVDASCLTLPRLIPADAY